MKIIVLLTVIVIIAISGYLYKRAMKSKLSESLGRDVADHEVDSIGVWLEAAPEKQKTYKKYVPAAKSNDDR